MSEYRELTEWEMQHTIAFDFDGVINPFTSGWCGIDKIPDPPDMKWVVIIRKLRRDGFRVVIMSSRALDPSGKKALEEYLEKYHIVVDEVTAQKVVANVYVDDRAYRADPRIVKEKGISTIVDELENFQTHWHEEGIR